MSFCRWSTDNYRCDLYCYEYVGGGYMTHVANNRPVDDESRPPDPDPIPMREDITPESIQRYCDQQNALSDWLQNCKREKISGPYDGATFQDETLEDFRDRLVMLREAGYRFPDDVLTCVDQEIAEQKDA